MTLLVRYGRPLELRRKSGTDLSKLLSEAAEGRRVEADDEGSFEGDFDPESLREALKNITNGGGRAATGEDGAAGRISLRREGAGASAVIEWRGFAQPDEDVFRGFAGGDGLRLALASKIIQAHGGEVAQDGDVLRARLPLQSNDERRTRDDG